MLNNNRMVKFNLSTYGMVAFKGQAVLDTLC